MFEKVGDWVLNLFSEEKVYHYRDLPERDFILVIKDEVGSFSLQ